MNFHYNIHYEKYNPYFFFPSRNEFRKSRLIGILCEYRKEDVNKDVGMLINIVPLSLSNLALSSV